MNKNNGPIGELEEEVLSTIKHWWVILIVGLLAIGVGIWMLFRPGLAYEALSIVFAVSFLVGGIGSCYFAIVNRKNTPAWGWNLVCGLLILVLGIILVTSPGMSAGTLIYYVGFAIVFGGFNTIGLAFALKNAGSSSGWGWNLALGIIIIILGFILMFSPLLAILTIVIWSGIGFITFGVSCCGAAYHLSKVKGIMKKS